MTGAVTSVLIVAMVAAQGSGMPPLSEEGVIQAIALGKADNVPIVQVGTFLGVSKGDFDVFVEGPFMRIAAAAAAAFRQYRPFDNTHVTDDMRAPVYRVFVRTAKYSRAGMVSHIVLQPRGAKGMDGVIQPVHEGRFPISQADFDRLPEEDFDVVLVTTEGTQKYNVSTSARVRVR